jgi:hypothetical protein
LGDLLSGVIFAMAEVAGFNYPITQLPNFLGYSLHTRAGSSKLGPSRETRLAAGLAFLVRGRPMLDPS